jgi:long-chain acyl-CoA synthetase
MTDTVETTLPATIARLPFFASGRYPATDLIGQCRESGVVATKGRELIDRVRDLSLGLASLGMVKGDRVALVSESRPEWLFADFAILTKGAVTVPIYSTLSADQMGLILRDSGARFAIASTPAQVEKLRAAIRLGGAVTAIVVMDDDAPAAQSGVAVLSMADVVARGHRQILDGWGVAKAYLDEANSVSPDDLATLIYTSGTTGEPKGVELTHGCLAANIVGSDERLHLGDTDVALSFLPLSHSFERMAAYLYLASGVSMIFAQSIDTIARDLLTVRPTMMTGAPRVFEKLFARIVERGHSQGGLKRRMFDWAMGVARRAGQAQADPGASVPTLSWRLADKLVFQRIRAGVGGRLRFAVSGSAPLRKDLAEVFAGLGLPILEGYGLTETAPVVSVTPYGRVRPGTVGPPLSNVEVKIADDGEILVRGPSIMRSYHNRPEDTARALEGGWFHTGDIGSFDEAGFLRITDRKKEMLITSGGKKIAPQAIEARFREHPLVADAVLVGDKRHFASVLIVPDRSAVARLSGAAPEAAFSAIVDRPDVQAAFRAIVDAVNAPLAQFEKVKKFYVVPDEWTIGSGLLTPTLKIRRSVVESRYRDVIDRLYA